MKTNIFLICMIACAPQLVWASSPACSSSSSSSGVSKQQALTQELKRALLALNFPRASQLVGEGADVNNVIDEKGTTPLMFATQREVETFEYQTRAGVARFFECALRAGASLDAINSHGKTVKDYAKDECALYLREVEIIHAIALRAHDPICLKNYIQNVDWQGWISSNFNFEQENAACKHPINYVFDRGGKNILMYAAHWNRTEDLRLLLNAPNIDIEARDSDNETVLHKSVQNSYFSDCAQLLIDHGAKINAKNCHERSALFEACHLGNQSGVHALYAHGAQSQDSLVPSFSRLNMDHDYAVMYYIMAEKPTRQKYGTDALFQEALQTWNDRMKQFKSCGYSSTVPLILNNEDTVANHMSTDQIKRCDAVIAKRSQLLNGGNILQLLKERETNPLHSSLLQRRLLQRVHALEAPAADLGEIVSQK